MLGFGVVSSAGSGHSLHGDSVASKICRDSAGLWLMVFLPVGMAQMISAGFRIRLRLICFLQILPDMTEQIM